jgi:hypothetical protein
MMTTEKSTRLLGLFGHAILGTAIGFTFLYLIYDKGHAGTTRICAVLTRSLFVAA